MPSGRNATAGQFVRTLPAFAYPLRRRYTGPGDIYRAHTPFPCSRHPSTKDDFDWIGKGPLSGSAR